ncbi:putative membrane protein [Acinetobacter sp. 479375]|nr:putative membrane protein [Acinetobacter sp. 479375]
MMLTMIIALASTKMNLMTLLWGWKKTLQGEKSKKMLFFVFFLNTQTLCLFLASD